MLNEGETAAVNTTPQYSASHILTMMNKVDTYDRRHPAWVEGRAKRCASLDRYRPSRRVVARAKSGAQPAARSRVDASLCIEPSINHLFDLTKIGQALLGLPPNASHF